MAIGDLYEELLLMWILTQSSNHEHFYLAIMNRKHSVYLLPNLDHLAFLCFLSWCQWKKRSYGMNRKAMVLLLLAEKNAV